MKLKTRLYMVAALPVLLLGIILTSISTLQLTSSVFRTNYSGMQATATAMRDVFQYIDSNSSEDAGKQAIESIDYIKEETGFDVTYFRGDTRYLTTITDENGDRLIGTKAGDEVIAEVLEQGNDYKNDKIDIQGVRYIGYYVPVISTDSGTPTGMIFLGIPYKTVYGRIADNVRNIIIAAVILLLLALLFAWGEGGRITHELQSSIQYVHKLEDGQLGFSIEPKLLLRSDVIGDMCRSIDSLNKRLTTIMTDIKHQCYTLDGNSATANQTANNLSDSITQISAVVEEVAATTTSQAEDAEHANENIQSMGDLIEHISSESSAAMSALNELVGGMQQVEHAVTAISEQTDQTCASVEKIDSAADLISSISLQTRLLSLNASIEAARAGIYGKGFAVVADEIQHLAHGSEESSKDIQQVVDELKQNSEQSLRGAKEVMNTVADLRTKLKTTEDVFMSLLREIGLENDSASSSFQSAMSLHSEREKTVSAVNDLAAATEEIAASMEQTSASVESVATMAGNMGTQAESLRKVSDTLSEHLKYFQIAEETT